MPEIGLRRRTASGGNTEGILVWESAIQRIDCCRDD
jgi:hypothetical protein